MDPSEKIAELTQLFPNSIEINKNVKGYTYSIKLRFNPGEELKTIACLKAIDNQIKAEFKITELGDYRPLNELVSK